MEILGTLRKPEYIFRPSQAIRRLWRQAFWENSATVVLPWGASIKVNTRETIGSCIYRVGIYDLLVSEALWRLAEPGEVAMDVGANIGHMTSLLVSRCGARGTVIAFEPHPHVFSQLEENCRGWSIGSAPIKLHNMALSERGGTAVLHVPETFSTNNGLASLQRTNAPHIAHVVTAAALDDIWPSHKEIGVMKIDVEGHELSVFRGARKLIEQRHIRDIVLEENAGTPSQTTEWLERQGYTLFVLNSTLLAPELVPLHRQKKLGRRDAPNLLATLNPQRAVTRFNPRGWKVMSGQAG